MKIQLVTPPGPISQALDVLISEGKRLGYRMFRDDDIPYGITQPSWVLASGNSAQVFRATSKAYRAGLPVAFIHDGVFVSEIKRDSKSDFENEGASFLTPAARLARRHFVPNQSAMNVLIAAGIAWERIHVLDDVAHPGKISHVKLMSQTLLEVLFSHRSERIHAPDAKICVL